jgi:hypothetical protein
MCFDYSLFFLCDARSVSFVLWSGAVLIITRTCSTCTRTGQGLPLPRRIATPGARPGSCCVARKLLRGPWLSRRRYPYVLSKPQGKSAGNRTFVLLCSLFFLHLLRPTSSTVERLKKSILNTRPVLEEKKRKSFNPFIKLHKACLLERQRPHLISVTNWYIQ